MSNIGYSLRRLLPFLACALGTGALGWIAATRFLEHPAGVTVMPRPLDEVARVGEVSITARELMEASMRSQPSGDPETAKSKLLDSVIRRELLYASAQQ